MVFTGEIRTDQGIRREGRAADGLHLRAGTDWRCPIYGPAGFGSVGLSTVSRNARVLPSQLKLRALMTVACETVPFRGRNAATCAAVATAFQRAAKWLASIQGPEVAPLAPLHTLRSQESPTCSNGSHWKPPVGEPDVNVVAMRNRRQVRSHITVSGARRTCVERGPRGEQLVQSVSVGEESRKRQTAVLLARAYG